MTRRRWRDSLKSFFGNHINAERAEQLKGTKTEIEDKVKKILKLIKGEDPEEKDGVSVENSKKEPLVELIEDFQKHYESLYDQYDHLTGELRKKFHGKQGTESSSSSSSDSELDYSSDNKGSKNGKLESEYQKITDDIKQELETVNLEVADLKRKLTALTEEKEALSLEHNTALSKIQEAEEIIGNLKSDAERLDGEKEKLLSENGELKQNLEACHTTEAELKQRLEEMSKEKDTAIRRAEEGEKITGDLEIVVNQLQEEKAVLGREVSSMKLQLESAGQQPSELSQKLAVIEENKSLNQRLADANSEKDNLLIEKEAAARRIEELESQKIELINQIADQQKRLEEQEEAYRKLSEEYKHLEVWFHECKANLEAAERKVEESAKDFHKNGGSKEQIIADLEETVEDLRRDLEVKGDELNTLVENVRTIEVKLRLSNQKLRVTEQLLTEKEESFRKAEAKYQQEQRKLEERVVRLLGIIAATNKAFDMIVRDTSEKVNSNMAQVDALTLKFEEDCNRYANCIWEMSTEIQIAKNRVTEMKNEKQQLGKEVSDLVMQLQGAKERESALKEKVKLLEIAVSVDRGEKKNLTNNVTNLEKKVAELEMIMKKKDADIDDLGEEKREAIRQLCLWIDYHRSRCDHLRERISKTSARGQRAA